MFKNFVRSVNYLVVTGWLSDGIVRRWFAVTLSLAARGRKTGNHGACTAGRATVPRKEDRECHARFHFHAAAIIIVPVLRHVALSHATPSARARPGVHACQL